MDGKEGEMKTSAWMPLDLSDAIADRFDRHAKALKSCKALSDYERLFQEREHYRSLAATLSEKLGVLATQIPKEYKRFIPLTNSEAIAEIMAKEK